MDLAGRVGVARMTASTRPLFAYIDCVRGYAVLLVITCHLSYEFKELPYPVHRLTTMGWYGVQLFFLASALTLLISWHHATNTGAARVVPFFLRRFFRIAPAYYAAAWLYYELTPPVGGFHVTQLIASLGFVNAWSPQLMSTVAYGWNVVPGGWSIGVEVTFYVLFPLFAALVTSLRRGLTLCGLCLIAGFAANRIAASILAQVYDPVPIDNFLYFWFPNQMIVFALGGVLYFAWRWLTGMEGTSFAGHLARHGNTLAALALALFFACAYLHLPHWIGLAPPYVPQFIVVSLCLAAFILALSQAPGGVFINPLATALGKVSFSAYLLHFAIIRLTVAKYPSAFHADSVGISAVAAFAAVWVVVVVLTSAAAWCSYRALELPMMTLGGKLARFSQGGGASLGVGHLVEITSVTTKQ
jgi:peptidoglycan/LPS O-acetylase OafA/YrhL